jgi:AAA15 family ATPase/GTPase
MFRIVTEIAKCKNSILLIDEIDTGIYYKKFKEYWKAILKIAKENNVQLFVTTHSKECLDYLVEAMEELGGDYQKELRYINMYRNKENRVMSSTYNYEEFKSDINIGNEVR